MSNPSKHDVVAKVHRFVPLVMIVVLSAIGMSVQAQEPESTSNAPATEQTDESAFDQTKAVRAIYEATKTAKTVMDFSAFLSQCDEALAAELSSANRKYVVSLSGWALNRRGEKRFEMAAQLKRIGNLQHQSAMKQAMGDFDAAIVAAPERYRSWMSRGIAHVANENYETAILDFTQVTNLKADQANGWFNRAEAYYHRGNYEAAFDDYEVAVRLNSTDSQALTGRALSAMAMGKSEVAIVDFDRVIELHPENDAAYINRGDCNQELARWNLASSDYQRAIEIKETATACQRCAWLKATCPDPEVRDAKAATELIERAIALTGDSTLNLDTLAAVEAANGNFDSAKTTQQKVIGLVNVEEDLKSSPYQARLALYEKSEPFVQKVEDESKDEKDDGPVAETEKENDEIESEKAPAKNGIGK